METAPAQGEEARERGTRPAGADHARDTPHPAADPSSPSSLSSPSATAHDGTAPASTGSRPRPEGIPAGPRWWRWWG
ncbi:hypothetical protein GXP71_15695 [Cellulomonas sp. H30R-01]|uniref:hypothetical protein n=1 Tax=Cellulomonas sp. H30R-01 TaxID=2704467 RepID=UPI00138D9025|nr:hypothetical protein [Cellulomonas sp. H30R-01]QHT57371.1 hypothetical protein GXP71_15695 [Cellulomonas sp. H30R-01]